MPGKHWAIPSSPTNWDCICGLMMCKQSFSNSSWLNWVYDKWQLSLPCSLMCPLLFRGWVSTFIRYREVCSSTMLFQCPETQLKYVTKSGAQKTQSYLRKGGVWRNGQVLEHRLGSREVVWTPHLLLHVGNVIKIWIVQCIRQGNVTCPVS